MVFFFSSAKSDARFIECRLSSAVFCTSSTLFINANAPGAAVTRNILLINVVKSPELMLCCFLCKSLKISVRFRRLPFLSLGLIPSISHASCPFLVGFIMFSNIMRNVVPAWEPFKPALPNTPKAAEAVSKSNPD